MKKIFLLLLMGTTAGPLGCMKQPDLKPDFGPEITKESWAVAKPEPPKFDSVQSNEYAYATRETWVEGRPYAINNRWAFTITSRSEQSDRYMISVVNELREYSQGEEKVSTRKADIGVAKTMAAPTAQSVTSAHYPTEKSARKALADTAPVHPSAKSSLISMSPFSLFARASLRTLEESPRITLHNLKFTKGSYPVPDFVKQRPNCGGLPTDICKGALKAYYLSFDQVNWSENGGQKYHMTRVYSSDVPFFASTLSPLVLTSEIDYFYPGVVQACVTTDLPYNGVTIQLTQCDEIKDFTFGHP